MDFSFVKEARIKSFIKKNKKINKLSKKYNKFVNYINIIFSFL